jgi:predicted enzyme related to lactoylglutathione lyase
MARPAHKGGADADPAFSAKIGRTSRRERQMAGELAFFELGVDDAERGRAFYGALFGWSFEPGPGDGFVISGRVPGGMHGGDPGASPYVFFAVEDIDAAAERVHELGGTIEEIEVGDDPDSAPEFGRFKLCRDDQGSPFGLHEAPSGRS